MRRVRPGLSQNIARCLRAKGVIRTMFCYQCNESNSAVGAIAICQRCGGAICRNHVRTLSHPGTPGGMLGLSQPKQEHVCSRCLTGDFPQPSRTEAPKQHQRFELPDALTAVVLADSLVRRQSRLQARKKQRWHSLSQWLGHHLPWGQNGEAKTPAHVQPTGSASQEG
jgi:hypothetical protein